jgi:hypothetical protein
MRQINKTKCENKLQKNKKGSKGCLDYLAEKGIAIPCDEEVY